MKKRHTVKNDVLCIGAVLFCVIAAVGGFFGVKGYLMYYEAVSEMSIEGRVEEIRNSKDFTQFSELPEFYIDAVISVEDHRFKQHCGIDLIAVGRAIWTDIKTMSWAEGGSTITQQVAKNLLFTQEKKIERKVAECFATFALESKYDKDEIFELYVNMAYFGSHYYGIYDASIGYFGKPPCELSNYESAMLAGLPNAPSVYSPDANMDLAVKRVSQVLQSMVSNKIITQEEANAIMDDQR